MFFLVLGLLGKLCSSQVNYGELWNRKSRTLWGVTWTVSWLDLGHVWSGLKLFLLMFQLFFEKWVQLTSLLQVHCYPAATHTKLTSETTPTSFHPLSYNLPLVKWGNINKYVPRLTMISHICPHPKHIPPVFSPRRRFHNFHGNALVVQLDSLGRCRVPATPET